MVQNQLVSELNSGQLVINWAGYNYNRTGTTIDTVDVNFTTFDKNTGTVGDSNSNPTSSGNSVVINDTLNISYSQFTKDTTTGVTGLLNDIKQHLITEFTPATTTTTVAG